MQLQSKVRSLEVERDDASFRNLELEDKVTGYAKLVNDFTSNIESLRYDFQRDLEALEPKKVEPILAEGESTQFPDFPPPSVQRLGQSLCLLRLLPLRLRRRGVRQRVFHLFRNPRLIGYFAELPYKGLDTVNATSLFPHPYDDWIKGGGRKEDYSADNKGQISGAQMPLLFHLVNLQALDKSPSA